VRRFSAILEFVGVIISLAVSYHVVCVVAPEYTPLWWTSLVLYFTGSVGKELADNAE
jgi:hypothetical protein